MLGIYIYTVIQPIYTSYGMTLLCKYYTLVNRNVIKYNCS